MRLKFQESDYIDQVAARLPQMWAKVDVSGVDDTLDLVVQSPSKTLYGIMWKIGDGNLHFGVVSMIEFSLSHLAQSSQRGERDPVLIFVTSQKLTERLLASVASLRFVLVEYDAKQQPSISASTVIETVTTIEAGRIQDSIAEKLCDPVSRFWETRSGGDALTALRNAASVSTLIGAYDRAHSLLNRVVNQQVSILGSNNLNVAATRIELAKLSVRMGEFRSAQVHADQALAAIEDGPGFGDDSAKGLWTSFADLLIDASNLNHLNIVDWQEVWGFQLRESSFLGITERLADRLFARRSFDRAEELYRRLLALIPISDQTAFAAEAKLANTLAETGRFDDAINHYVRAIDGLSLSDSNGQAAAFRLADLLAARGDLEGAERLYRRIISTVASSDTVQYQTNTKLAEILARQGKIAEAEGLYRSTIDTLSPSDPRRSNVVFQLANLRSVPRTFAFRDREHELDEVISTLENDDAGHFWLYVAPPQVGKTWFLRRIGQVFQRRRSSCHVEYVDARDIAADAQDPVALLARMYGVSPAPSDTFGIATAISRRDRYSLCLLDSAEMLREDTTRALRAGLAQITRYVQDARSQNARVALVAASRQDDAWSGVLPLRMEIRALAEFDKNTVLDALRELADRTSKNSTRAELEPLASDVHRLTEGLPALLAASLTWIERVAWVGLDRLRERDTFDEVTHPYISGSLLSSDSLLGRRPDPNPELQSVLIEALRALAPYRYFTGSYLSYHARKDPLSNALRRLNWSDEGVWTALSHTDVLLRPNYEPWLAISPPVRRLLFRYWYPEAAGQVEAHLGAREFLDSWGRYLTGSERAKAIVECLWHEAEALSLSHDPGQPDRLIQLARGLSAELSESAREEAAKAGMILVPRFRQREIRDFICKLLDDDTELVHAINDVDLYASIREIMRRPDGGSMS